MDASPKVHCVSTCNRRRAEERIEPRLVEQEPRRLAIYTVQPITLALVHWQQPEAADPAKQAAYLQHWGLTASPCSRKTNRGSAKAATMRCCPLPGSALARKACCRAIAELD